jgi:aryl-alcohol dehydrogenase-like predicted oxidoreductase
MKDLATRTLGKTGLEVTTLGVGCAWLGRRADGSIDEETGLAAILAALDSGVRLIDTASLYVSLLAAALQYVVRHPAVSTTVPGARRPDQAIANTAAMLEPIPDRFWQELEPLTGNFNMALPPPD